MYYVISYNDNNIKYINVVTDDEYKMLNRKCEILFSSNDIQSISDFYKKAWLANKKKYNRNRDKQSI